jgi:hypothetical protein
MSAYWSQAAPVLSAFTYAPRLLYFTPLRNVFV